MPDAPTVVEQRIEQLKAQNEKLAMLLNDPHPGLFTWFAAVARATGEIAAIMAGQRDV